VLRSELAQKIAEQNPHLRPRDANAVIDAVFGAIIEALSRGDRVELRGFGSFTTRTWETRLSRDPRTGESIDIAGRRVLFFRPGKDIRIRLNRAGASAPREARAPASRAAE
jgi:integration host factor subunit beta